MVSPTRPVLEYPLLAKVTDTVEEASCSKVGSSTMALTVTAFPASPTKSLSAASVMTKPFTESTV
jgi:hypothetical protein